MNITTIGLAHCAAAHYSEYSLHSALALAADHLGLIPNSSEYLRAVEELLALPDAHLLDTRELLATAIKGS